MSCVTKDTYKDIGYKSENLTICNRLLWRIAVNLAEIADFLAEMNGYKVDSIYDEEDSER